jgi:hypothetical protein
MLSPENVGKIQVIHENYYLLKKVEVPFYCCIHLCYKELIVYKYLLMSKWADIFLFWREFFICKFSSRRAADRRKKF